MSRATERRDTCKALAISQINAWEMLCRAVIERNDITTLSRGVYENIEVDPNCWAPIGLV